MQTRYTFSKNERLCSKKQIDILFKNGRWLRSEHLRLAYILSETEITVQAQVLITVPKKYHRRAVKRNLLKRRLREAYRLFKPKFYSAIIGNEKPLLIAVVYSSSDIIDYKAVQSELSNLLLQVAARNSRL
jgi:ribonuclease P protein component